MRATTMTTAPALRSVAATRPTELPLGWTRAVLRELKRSNSGVCAHVYVFSSPPLTPRPRLDFVVFFTRPAEEG